MGNTNLDSLLEAGASAGVADIDHIMSLIRAHAHGSGNGNGCTPAPQPSPAVQPPAPAVGEALKAQAEFNHELMGALRVLGDQFLALQSQVVQLQEQQRAGAEQAEKSQESLSSLQNHSTAVEQEVNDLKRGLAETALDLAGEHETNRQHRFSQVRQLAQLEERIGQVNTVLLATGRRVDGVANRAYTTEQTVNGLEQRIEDESAERREQRAEIEKMGARATDQEQRLGRVSGEIAQRWEQELANRDTTYREQLAALQTGLDSVGAWFNQELGAAQEHLESELKALREQVSAHAQSDQVITGQFKADWSSRTETLDQKLEGLSAQATTTKEQFDHRFDELTMRLLRAERATADGVPQPSQDCANFAPLESAGSGIGGEPRLGSRGLRPSQGSALRNPDPPMDYFMFSLQHRGSLASVRERQAAYVDLFRGRKQVLDLGCGRGEFLGLISGNGTRAVGVDSNRDMIDFGREHGLDVVHADLFEYLQALPDTGVDGIFSAQVIEHLSPDDIRTLIRLCGQKLGASGLLVLETVNPLCPLALTNFWLDPTHVRPVLPKLLTFMLQEAGFSLKALRFNSPIEGSSAAPSFETVTEWPSVLDQYQDYAAIASRGE